MVTDRVRVDGRALWVRVDGTGPSVVFLPGAGAFGLDLFRCAERLSATTTTVLYDRAGTGFSDDAPLPRPLSTVTAELRALLPALGMAPPFVLVGHSLGGAYAQHFASAHPDETAGLVLLDPVVRNWNREMPEQLRIGRGASRGYTLEDIDVEAEREWLERELAELPSGIRNTLIERHLAPDRLLTGPREGGDFIDLIDALPDRPVVPTVVLHATAIDPLQAAYRAPELLEQQIAAMRRLYLALVESPGDCRSLPTATHSTIATAFPAEVADAVGDVLARSRGSRSAPVEGS
ncbi:alpha/beta fold hydrolase [Microbacterium sp.]|uniref:alpha/beta fold hydrolase n=1 Tax=Microbacterium sp. TaxID=51671 RepID=UPI0039E4083F